MYIVCVMCLGKNRGREISDIGEEGRMASLCTCGNFTRRVIQVFSIPGSPDRRVRKTQTKYDLLATKAGKIDCNAHPTGAYQPIGNENSPSLPNGKHLANGQITRLRSKRFRSYAAPKSSTILILR